MLFSLLSGVLHGTFIMPGLCVGGKLELQYEERTSLSLQCELKPLQGKPPADTLQADISQI